MAVDDSRLLMEARSGDERSFLSLYQRYRTPLFRFAWRLTADRGRRRRYRSGMLRRDSWPRPIPGGSRLAARVSFWNCAQPGFRSIRQTSREEDPPEDFELAGSPYDDLLATERSTAVAGAVAALPTLQREALVLFEYENLSLEEIAHIAAVDIGAIKGSPPSRPRIPAPPPRRPDRNAHRKEMLMNQPDPLDPLLQEWEAPEPSRALDARVRSAFQSRPRPFSWRSRLWRAYPFRSRCW